jgi:hypothetical protein
MVTRSLIERIPHRRRNSTKNEGTRRHGLHELERMNVLGKPGRAKKDFSSFRALDHSTPFFCRPQINVDNYQHQLLNVIQWFSLIPA